ncbi:MAG: NAD(P)H-dependent oxidoreductase [Deltaproteobacteria bacterium]|jgi:NAD(P)H dehydrogenase (quinone)|nr:NAD(P)H-dependent oxidoreductase [Deltaproteobacteria bacterium]
MKHLIIYSHPNPGSFCHAILEVVEETLALKKHDIVVRDLYALGFDPVLKAADFAEMQSGKTPADIKAEQDHIAWSDMMTIIHPVWWTGLPAMIKGYIDRVFSYGFAYSTDAKGIVKLLTDKKVIIFNTQGTPEPLYEKSGMFVAMKKTSDMGIYEFCGVNVLAHQFFGAVPYVNDAARKGYLEKVRQIVSPY